MCVSKVGGPTSGETHELVMIGVALTVVQRTRLLRTTIVPSSNHGRAAAAVTNPILLPTKEPVKAMWSKRSRLQMAVAVAVGVISVICITVAIGTWKATSSEGNDTAATDLNLNAVTGSPTGIPTKAPNRFPSSVGETPLSSPSPVQPPTASPSLPVSTPRPSKLTTQAPTQHPTRQPVSTTQTPTSSPTRVPTGSPTSRPTLAPTASARIDFDNGVTTFYSIADTPYTQAEARELPIQVRSLPPDAEFLVHLGDIRSARNGGSWYVRENASSTNQIRFAL